ncbi:MAG: NUDIX hydrolase [Candidatus Altiarchaeota archaeon]|nr:NUDIX hydrolase [Candidatus Altiarchaeota archaeon]
MIPKHPVSTKALIEKDGKFLMIKTSRGGYMFPGGLVEEKESLENAVIREVKEETGLQIEVGTFFHANKFNHPKGGENVVLFFKCNIIGGEEKLGSEIDHEFLSLDWVSPSDMTDWQKAIILAKRP